MICGSSSDGETNYPSTSPYRTMSEIRAFFDRAEVRPSGESSTRKWFVVESLRSVNGRRDLEKVLLRLSSPKEYRGDSTLTRNVIQHLNQALKLEGLEIVITGGVDPMICECPPNMSVPTPRVVRRTRQTTRPDRPESDRDSDEQQATGIEHGTERPKSTLTSIFIGHGHSHVWRELKDFLQDRLGLSVDEYSRVSNVGRPTTQRLSEMLDAATAALLLMTGEDETPEGKLRARENVVHEVGLFQGRLGFEKAIVLLEEGCEEFSNIVGLEQIRFQKGDISTGFEKIRMFLERENILS